MPASFVHKTADVHPAAEVGEGTQIWQNVVVTSCAKIGANCTIGANCFIDGVIGDYCKIANGVSVFQGVILESNVFVSHGVAFANVTIPRTFRPIERQYYKQTVIEEGATLEINATVAPGIRIGHHAIVGMGSVILEDVPPNYLVHGNPATISIRSLKGKLKKYERKD